jgi:vacuolar-type H+-ATPase subunit H
MSNQKILDWYQKEIEKDKIEIDNNKKKFISSIKSVDKEKIFENKVKKISLWRRIMKVLGGI